MKPEKMPRNVMGIPVKNEETLFVISWGDDEESMISKGKTLKGDIEGFDSLEGVKVYEVGKSYAIIPTFTEIK